jgi:hypothetical protein
MSNIDSQKIQAIKNAMWNAAEGEDLVDILRGAMAIVDDIVKTTLDICMESENEIILSE